MSRRSAGIEIDGRTIGPGYPVYLIAEMSGIPQSCPACAPSPLSTCG